MTPSSLAGLQSAFKRYLFAGDNEADLAALVASDREAPAPMRLDVYRNAYYVRLEEALARDFPVLRAVLGDEGFGRLMAAYLVSHPSTKHSLRFVGERLADWLRRTGHDQPWVDIVALEWAVLHAWDAPEEPKLCPPELFAVPAERWPELRLKLDPSVTLLEVEANVRQVWLAVRRGEKAPLLEPAKERLLVWRSPSGIEVQPLSEECHALLALLAPDRTLALVCEDVEQRIPASAAPGVVARHLRDATARGWIGGMT